MEDPVILSVEHVTKRFGGLVAVNDVSLTVKEREIVGVMGPNGAGKSSLFNLIAGTYKPDSGKIIFKGHDITGVPPHKACHLGIGRTYQIPQPFVNLRPRDNILVGAMYGAGMSRPEAEAEATRLFEVVNFPEKEGVLCCNLAAVALKRLEVARALAGNPSLMLLDEIAAGSNDSEIPRILDMIRGMRDMGKSVILVEHVMKVIVEVVDRLIVMDKGSIIAEGRPAEVMKDKKVVEAYFG